MALQPVVKFEISLRRHTSVEIILRKQDTYFAAEMSLIRERVRSCQ